MAAPSIDFNMNLIEELQQSTNTFVAPLRESANFSSSATYQQGEGWRTLSNITGLYGGRCVLLSGGSDFTTKPYIFFQLAYQSFNSYQNMETLANGGIRILFEDSLGNWARFNIHGSEIYSRDSFPVFNPVGNDGRSRGHLWIIDRSRTPDASSGTIDWSDIVAFETHGNITSPAENPDLILGRLNVCGNPIITAGEALNPGDLDFVNSQASNIPNNSDSGKWFGANQDDQLGGLGRVFMHVYGLQIGDGTTETYWDQGPSQLAIYPSKEVLLNDTLSLGTYGAAFQGDDSAPGYGRQVVVNQSATDTVLFKTGFIFSGVESTQGGEYDVIVQGSTSGTCTFTGVQFYNANKVELAHATSTDCQFQNVTDLVINSNSSVTGSTYSGAIGSNNGLVVDDIAGDYSGIDIRFNNNNQYDISLGAGGAGTYNFSGISVASGYTLKIRNNSATNAVTIIVPAGITTSTSTAGGSITVQTPAATYTLELPNIIDGSRFQIFNVTTDTELTNSTTSGGTGIDETYTAGTNYTAGDEGRYRVTYQSGTTCKRAIEATFTFPGTTTTNSIPISQEDDPVYTQYGVDGSGITEFTWDSGNIQVDINDANNETVVQRIAAWMCYFTTTATGIDEAFGSLTWESINSIRINTSVVDLTLDNTKATPLFLNGGRLYRDDNNTIISSTSNAIQVDYQPVYAIETGVSGLTTSEANKLNSLGTPGDIADAVWDEPISGHLTAGSTGEALDNAGGSSATPPTEAEIYTYFTSASREDSFKANVSGLASQSSVNALNDLSAADVNAQVDIALSDYDAPTKAELDAGFAGLNDLSAAQVNAEVDTALADYDAPTKAELDAAQTAITNAISALNDLSAAQVNAEVDQALLDYDGPTKAELDAAQSAIESAISGLNDPTAAVVAAAVWDYLQSETTVSGSLKEAVETVLTRSALIPASV